MPFFEKGARVNGATKASYCPFHRLIPDFHRALIVRFTPAAFFRQRPMRCSGPSAIGDSHLGRVGLDLMLTVLAPDDQAARAAAALPSVSGGPGSDFI
jgi:hypothetical protein